MFMIRGGTMINRNGTKVEGNNILVRDGRILEVGIGFECPSEATVIEAKGKFITPGLIDVHSHLGLKELGIGKDGADQNETSASVTPQVRSLDGINPFDQGFQNAVASGVTSVQVMPGSTNVIGGEMVAIKTYGRIIDHMVIKNPTGMKAAFGENTKRVHGSKDRPPVSRMGIASMIRQQFMKAQDYQDALARGSSVQRDLGLDNLIKVLNREMPLRAHAHRADDIVTVLRLADEFALNVTIEHCSEGHLIADFIAEKQVRVSVGPTMASNSKPETSGRGWHTLIALAKAGVPISITTDHPVVSIQYLVTSAATAVGFGLDEQVAWQAITMNAAEHIGIGDRVGSIESGKDADLVIWSGHPFDIRNQVEITIIDGEIVYGGISKTDSEG